jgi:hypothetical protein
VKCFDYDFAVVVELNRGTKDGNGEIHPPEYFVFPVDILRRVPRTKDWGDIEFKNIPNLKSYEENWELIRTFLKKIKKDSKVGGVS